MISQALVCTCDDVLAHWLSFDAEGVKELGICLARHDICDFPSQVEGILDAGVGPQAVERWVSMGGIAEAEAAS